jgi:hypothetical protein
MSLVGSPSATLTARAVTVLGNNGGAGCVFAMDPFSSQALNVSGGSSDSFACGVEVASSSGTAISLSGGATLTMKNNSIVGVVGGWSISGGAQIVNANTGNSESPQQISAPADPLGYVTAPSTTGLTVQSMSKVNYSAGNKPPGNTMQPGIYCGGFTVSGGISLTMAKGVYYIAGGGFSISGGSTVTGSGVTIYTTSGTNSGVTGCSTGFQSFSVSGGSNVQLSAPTSGALEGILIFQDRKISSPLSNTFSGGATTQLNGAIYLLHSPLSYSGGTSTAGYQILVTDSLTLSGGNNINNDYSSLQDGSPVRHAAILTE